MSNQIKIKTELWVDLESTIIPHWDYIDDFINESKFETLIETFAPHKIVIYSYAIWCEDNRELFKKSEVYKKIAARFPVTIKTTKEMEEDCGYLHQHMKHIPERTIWYVPKEFSFLMSVRKAIEKGSDTHRFVLFDDTAPHGNNYTINDNQQVFYFNPDNMS